MQTVDVEIYVDLPEDSPEDAAEQFVLEILSNEPRIELVKVTRTSVLYER